MRFQPTLNLQFFYWATILAALLGTSVLTFSIGPISLFPFRIALISLIVIFLLKKGGKFELNTVHVKKSLIFHVFWVVYALTSLCWAVDKVEAIKHVIFILLNVLIIYFSIYFLRGPKDFWRLVNIWLIVFVFLLPIGVWEYLTGNHLPSSGLNVVDVGYELYKFAPTATFSNQNDYATWIALTFPLLLSLFRYSGFGLKRLFYGLVLLLTVLVLLFTTSRANYIAVGLSSVFWLLFMTNLREKFRYFVMICILLLLITKVLPEYLYEQLAYFIDDFVTLTEIGKGGDQGIDVRENLVKNGLIFFTWSWGFGLGAGNVEYYMAKFPVYPVGNIANVHNWFVELLANYGLFIFIGYVYFLIYVFFALWRIYKTTTSIKNQILAEALLCALVGFPISSISSSSLMAFTPIWIYFGFVLAFINFNYHTKQTLV
jgi:teichuronic acid biosynthesis protein TuaE